MDHGKGLYKIIVSGIVQGVGFRPLTFRIALKHGIRGTVRNIGGKVEILAYAGEEELFEFLNELRNSKSTGCEITNMEITEQSSEENIIYNDFRIIESGSGLSMVSEGEASIIPPDLAVCSSCSSELFLASDRRFKNPFISCMSCGPRYTIIEELPYDRDNTTMIDFAMCPECKKEYTSPLSRRFHAQTISCYDCGPYLIFGRTQESPDDAGFEELTDEDAFNKTVEIINNGGIVAVKGIGGYHFVCTPFSDESGVNLRKLKCREEKPFAVMFEDMDSIREYCEADEKEEELLLSNARPIVLLKSDNDRLAWEVHKGSAYCGAFLPYTPLQIRLLKECGPLIMTSANVSGKPVIKSDEEIFSLKSPFLSGVLYNKRRIVRSVDDSVAKVIDGRPQIIRRSRGYVPYPVFIKKVDNRESQIFAAGGDLKSAFCMYKDGQAVVSQYFGDLEEQSIMNEYVRSYEDLTLLLKTNPELVVCDMHPGYFSSNFVRKTGIPVIEVQHHHAHIASVMAENNLSGKVIGVAFDGTGYGTDGCIWGGEFLICEGGGFVRAGHLKYTKMLGGDKSMKDAKKTADCFLIASGLKEYIEDERSSLIEAAVMNDINTVISSSMGRLFDAAASILGICHENVFEGECASRLEKEAKIVDNKKMTCEYAGFEIHEENGMIISDPAPVLTYLCSQKSNREKSDNNKNNKGRAALGFHYAVADMVLENCVRIRDYTGSNTVALSGGVFQNTLLTSRILDILRENNFNVFLNRAVPPNDGSISLGQVYVGLNGGR